uniref:Transposase n=1 Tax=Magnetococcus massalia (strain MO-1) TaxID=451514 RepID=A0A1S7LJ52_MAGMO|nr:transposase [Candidatus Magnetococcus massalia]
MSKFIQADQNQPLLLPPDLREWIPEDDLAHFILEAVKRVPLERFKVNRRRTGSAQYHPQMMLALLIYCYANGIFGSRRIERATYRDIGVRFITADTHLDHDTICTFRRVNGEAISEAFLQVLLLAKELKLLKVGMVSVDGTKMDANANKHHSVRYDRAQSLRGQLELDIADLMEQAESTDKQDAADPQSLPEEISQRKKLLEKMDAACDRLEKQAKAQAEREQEEYRKKLEERDKRSGKRKGRKPKPPKEEPDPKEQTNLTDPDSRIMRKSKQHEYRQAYNAQAVVDADGSQLILGSRVSQCASDRNELQADIGTIPSQIGQAETVLADSGYANGKEVSDLQKQGVEVLVATGAEGQRRAYDFRPPPEEEKEAKEPKADWLKEMQAALESEEGRRKYGLRKQTVEPVFGIIKSVLGFTQFQLRGLSKVALEWDLVSLAYNCKRLHRLQLA